MKGSLDVIDRDVTCLRLEKKTEGVIYGIGEGPWPPTVKFNDHIFHRFHDFIYVSERLDELSSEQVVAVCELRESFSTDAQLSRNRSIRDLFIRLIKAFSPNSLLEIGPGTHPIFAPTDTDFLYKLAELDSRSVRRLVDLGHSVEIFDSVTPLTHIPANSIEMIVALFVFHFPIGTLQAIEMRRVLKDEGIIIANVYRRSAEARENLRELFRTQGLQLEIVRRSDGVNYEHEYWILGKDLGSLRCSQALDLIRNTSI
jgi:hypothetical protein